MTLHQFQIMLSVAKHQSVKAAANENHISQPAVSLHIKLLEEQCEVKLFTKYSKGIQITDAGRKFIDSTKEILSLVENLKNICRDDSSNGNDGSLRIGSHHGMSEFLSQSILVVFKKDNPKIQLFFHSELSPTLESMVQNSEIEIAVISNPSFSNSLIYETFRIEKATAIVSRNYPLANKGILSIKELSQEPLIVLKLNESQSLSEKLLKDMRDQGSEMSAIIYCESMNANISSVKAGMGIGIAHKKSVEKDIIRGDLIEIKIPLLNTRVETFIIYHKEHPLSPVAKDCLSFLRKWSQ